MKVKLLTDILVDGVIRQSPRREPTFKQQWDPTEKKHVRVPVRVGSEPLLWVKGAVVEMSDASAKKYIECGQAEPFSEEPPANG